MKRPRLFPAGRRQWVAMGIRLGVFLAVLFLGVCMMVQMPGESYRGPLPPLTESEKSLEGGLKRHVESHRRSRRERAERRVI